MPEARRDEYDSPWKEILDVYLPHAMELLFPRIHAAIDWKAGWESLEKELPQIVRDAALGARLADKLIKARTHDAVEVAVLLHFEVQGWPEIDFEMRMFVYNYRIFDAYGLPVISLAVLADDHASWRPDRYARSHWGCELSFRFPIVKLRDYNERRAELASSRNPFAVILLAHLDARATRKKPEQRLRAKRDLVRHLYEGGFSKQDVLEIFWFMDWVMKLPEGLELQFKREMQEFEEESKMRYVTSIERIGRQEGRQEGRMAVVKRLLAKKFGEIPGWVDERLGESDEQELDLWAERTLDAPTLEQVFQPRVS